MNRPTALQQLEAALLRGALGLLRVLGPVRASNLGGAVARCIGPLLPVSRVAHANLRLALPALDATARQRIVRGVWDNLGRTVAEMPHVAGLRATEAGPGWEIVGEAVVRGLAAQGGPMVFVSGHLGNWEVLPVCAASFGLTMANFYRAPANALVDAMLLDLRGVASGQFRKGASGARQALAHLGRGGSLAMLVDQKMNDGIASPFFGHMAMTAPAAAAFALRFGCPVVPAYTERLGPARFRVVCEAPLPLPASGRRGHDIALLTRDINACLERWIAARPESWLWLHRRWPKETAPTGLR